MEPSRILSKATGAGAGPTLNLYGIFRSFTFVKTITGVFTGLVINYEGSLDGVNWYTLGTDNTTGAGPTFVVDRAAKYVRANVTTFTGGTDVTVDMVPMP